VRRSGHRGRAIFCDIGLAQARQRSYDPER